MATKTKNINILLRLQDQFTPKLKGTTAEIKKQKSQINAATTQINKWANNANRKFKSVMSAAGRLAGALGVIGGGISIYGMKNFADNAIEAAERQIDAVTKLQTLLGNVPGIAAGGTGAIQAATTQLTDFAGQLQKVGVIGDEITIAGMQQLATFQLNADQIQTLSTGMADLLAQTKGINATQEDAVSIANLMGKAMSGNTGALTRVGIIMTDDQKRMMQMGDQTQRAATLAEILAMNVGGVNEALAKTDQGRIKQAGNIYADMQERIGAKLLTIKARLAEMLMQYLPYLEEAAMKLVDKLGAAMEKIGAWVEEHKEEIKAALEQIGKTVGALWKIASTVLTFVIRHGKILLPILGGMLAYFVAFNIITKVAGMLSALTTVIKGVSAAGKVLNLVMMANPIILIAAAIAILIVAGVALIKHWDQVVAFFQKVWGIIKTKFEHLRDIIIGVFKAIKKAIQPIIDWIQARIEAVQSAIDKVIETARKIGGFFKGVFGVNAGDAQTAPKRGFATGTSYFAGGAARINEGGRGETVVLPSGTQIIPKDREQKQKPVINVSLNIQGNVIGNRAFMEQCGSYIASRIMAAQGVI